MVDSWFGSLRRRSLRTCPEALLHCASARRGTAWEASCWARRVAGRRYLAISDHCVSRDRLASVKLLEYSNGTGKRGRRIFKTRNLLGSREIKILKTKRAYLSRSSRNLRGRSGMTEAVVVIEWMSSGSKPTPVVRDYELPFPENYNVWRRADTSRMVVGTSTVWRQVP